jgi:hypothetical protein
MAALAAMLWAVCGLAHADWAVRGDETGVTLIGAVSDDAASGEKLWGGRRRSWHLHRPHERMEVAPWPKSMISAEA